METTDKTRQLAIAIYTVNRHAKTAIDKKELYQLKKLTLEKLIQEKKAKKIGLHFVEDPTRSKQQSTTLVACADFLFHMISQKEDFKELPHLGKQDQLTRNPQERMGLKQAKQLLTDYLGLASKPSRTNTIKTKKTFPSKGFRSSYLDG